MRINELAQCVDLCCRSRVTPFIWGKHGIGKSATIKWLTYQNDWGVVDERLAQCEAADIRGLPAKDEENRRTVYFAPGTFPKADMTIEQIVEQLALSLKSEIPTETIDGLSPLKQLRVAMKLGRYAKTTETKSGGVSISFTGEEIPYPALVDATATLELLQPRFPFGILFLDEMNRAEDDVLQASFELVYDRKTGQYVLPPGWAVVAAGNFSENYMVNPSFNDPALIDRFCHLTLDAGEATMDDWGQWMAQEHGEVAQKIIEFGLQNVDHIYGKNASTNDDLKIAPSPRSWDMVARVEMASAEGSFSKEVTRYVISGLVGQAMATKYMLYTCPVAPRDILEKGVAAVRTKLDKITKDNHSRGIFGGLVFGILSFMGDRMDDENSINNCYDLAQYLIKAGKQNDLAVAFMHHLVGNMGVSGGSEKEALRAALISNPALTGLVGDWEIDDASGMLAVKLLNKRPELKELMMETSWGIED